MFAIELVKAALEKNGQIEDEPRQLTEKHAKLLTSYAQGADLTTFEKALSVSIAHAMCGDIGAYRNSNRLRHYKGKVFMAADNFVFYEGVRVDQFTFGKYYPSQGNEAQLLELLLEKHLNAGLVVGWGTSQGPSDVCEAKHPQFLLSLYVLYRKGDTVVAVCNRFGSKEVVAIQKGANGAVEEKVFPAIHMAMHTLAGQGFQTVSTLQTSYEMREELFGLLGVSDDDEFGRLTGFEFAKV